MPKSFVDVIADGNFRYISNLFDRAHMRDWSPSLGDTVRGELVVIAMGAPLYSEPEVQRCMARKDARLRPATAYELVTFAASDRWKGRPAMVMALGSRLNRGAVPLIGIEADRTRALKIDAPEHGFWGNDRSILCVKV